MNMRANLKYRIAERSGEKGQALIELAIVIPLLVVLLMGVIDFSRAILAKSTITNMSREAANLIARANPNLSGVEQTDAANVMDMIGKTAGSLKMTGQGMMYISTVEYDTVNNKPNRVTLYAPWSRGVTTNKSKINPTGISTTNLNASTPLYVTAANLGGLTLTATSQQVYVVEVYYQYNSIFQINALSFPLYSVSIY